MNKNLIKVILILGVACLNLSTTASVFAQEGNVEQNNNIQLDTNFENIFYWETESIPSHITKYAVETFDDIISTNMMEFVGSKSVSNIFSLGEGFTPHSIDERGKDIYYFPIYSDNEIKSLFTVIDGDSPSFELTEVEWIETLNQTAKQTSLDNPLSFFMMDEGFVMKFKNSSEFIVLEVYDNNTNLDFNQNNSDTLDSFDIELASVSSTPISALENKTETSSNVNINIKNLDIINTLDMSNNIDPVLDFVDMKNINEKIQQVEIISNNDTTIGYEIEKPLTTNIDINQNPFSRAVAFKNHANIEIYNPVAPYYVAPRAGKGECAESALLTVMGYRKKGTYVMGNIRSYFKSKNMKYDNMYNWEWYWKNGSDVSPAASTYNMVNFNNIKYYVNRDRPLWSNWNRVGGGDGHAYVICGYGTNNNKNYILLKDPNDRKASAYKIVPFNGYSTKATSVGLTFTLTTPFLY